LLRKNQSPKLSWENAPAGNKGLAITMHDPDAPRGSGFWNWVVFNIPSSTNELLSGAGDIKLNLTSEGAIQSITNYSAMG